MEVKVESELGALIDGTEIDFKKFCADKDLGYIRSLHTQFTGIYHMFVRMKDDLMKKIVEEKLPNTCPEKVTIDGIYAELFKIESKIVMLSEMIEKRRLPN